MNNTMNNQFYGKYYSDSNLNNIIIDSYDQIKKEKKPEWCSDIPDTYLKRISIILLDDNKAKELYEYLNNKTKHIVYEHIKEYPSEPIKIFTNAEASILKSGESLDKKEDINKPLSNEEIQFLLKGFQSENYCGSDTNYISNNLNYTSSSINKKIINELNLMKKDLNKNSF